MAYGEPITQQEYDISMGYEKPKSAGPQLDYRLLPKAKQWEYRDPAFWEWVLRSYSEEQIAKLKSSREDSEAVFRYWKENVGSPLRLEAPENLQAYVAQLRLWIDKAVEMGEFTVAQANNMEQSIANKLQNRYWAYTSEGRYVKEVYAFSAEEATNKLQDMGFIATPEKREELKKNYLEAGLSEEDAERYASQNLLALGYLEPGSFELRLERPARHFTESTLYAAMAAGEHPTVHWLKARERMYAGSAAQAWQRQQEGIAGGRGAIGAPEPEERPSLYPQYESVFRGELESMRGPQSALKWFESMYPTLLGRFRSKLGYMGQPVFREEALKREKTWLEWLKEARPRVQEEFYKIDPFQRGERPSYYAPRIQTVNF